MPNYIFRCVGCEYAQQLFLPISSDPSQTIECPDCAGTMTRRIGATMSFSGFKEFAGDWFKKTYGHELGEKDIEKVERQKDMEKSRREMTAELNEGKNIPQC